MRQRIVVVVLSFALFGAPTAGWSAPVDAPYGGGEPTQQDEATSLGYYPFSVVGHGVLFVAKYAVGYPLWFLFKPVHGFLYSSSQDPNDMDPPVLKREEFPDRPAR